MKKTVVASLTVATALACGMISLNAQSAGRNVWSGVFTAAQADRGKALFAANCAKCHGDTLQGEDQAPQLAGSNFMSNWNGENVGDLVDRIHSSMPADNPGSLSLASATDLATFILSSNQIPAGATELPHDQQLQSQIRIDANKPASP
jgi:S-disulfanyl-L-cysteine oxidoreductase SoxD